MEWIKITDGEPVNNKGEEYDEYITYCCNNKWHDPIVTTLDWTEDGWTDGEGNCWDDYVTHWMPLPQPPTEDK